MSRSAGGDPASRLRGAPGHPPEAGGFPPRTPGSAKRRTCDPGHEAIAHAFFERRHPMQVPCRENMNGALRAREIRRLAIAEDLKVAAFVGRRIGKLHD